MIEEFNLDAGVVRDAVAALDKSTSTIMLRVNLEYLWDRYIRHPIPGQVFGEPTQVVDLPLDTRLESVVKS